MTAPERLRAPQLDERLAVMNDLAASGDADAVTVGALVECLAHQSKAIQRRAAETLKALAARGVAVRDVLLQALQAAAPAQRWGAAYALSLLGAPPAEVLPVLLECLGADDGDVRWAAAAILVPMREPGLDSTLCSVLRSGSARQRKMAAYCLRDRATRLPTIEQAMLEATGDPEPGVRMAAISALARVSAEPTVAAQRLVAMFHDPDAGVRRAAAAALGALGYRSDAVLAALRAATDSADLSLQRAAGRSLRRLGSAA